MSEQSARQESLANAFSGRLITDENDKAPFLVDWRKRYQGNALGIAIPDTVQDVAKVVQWCRDNQHNVVPQGGNTGMSGAATPDQSSNNVVLSLTRLNSVRAIDRINNTITVDAGCTLAEVQQAAEKEERLFPLSLPSEGSCTIGGNLSTNAGGCQVLRYGNARELCLGVEVVTANGELWDGLRGLRKDNTGYDLRDLFVGSEGTLGVITAATLKLYPLPAAKVTALATVQSPKKALELLDLAQQHMASSLTAFELISDICLDLVAEHFENCPKPFTPASPYYVLLECSDAESEAHATERFEILMTQAFEAEIVTDAIVADSLARSRQLWAFRENISEAQSAAGKNIKHDISVPISAIGEFIEQTNKQLIDSFDGIRMVVFGHLGDGNLHYNVSPPAEKSGPENADAFLALQPDINRLTHDAVVAAGGSISAEHGLGVLRRDENARYKSDIEMSLMHAIKRTLDPDLRMNPGKVIKL